MPHAHQPRSLTQCSTDREFSTSLAPVTRRLLQNVLRQAGELALAYHYELPATEKVECVCYAAARAWELLQCSSTRLLTKEDREYFFESFLLAAFEVACPRQVIPQA